MWKDVARDDKYKKPRARFYSEESEVLAEILDLVCAGDFAIACETAARRLFAIDQALTFDQESWITILRSRAADVRVLSVDTMKEKEREVEKQEKRRKEKFQKWRPNASAKLFSPESKSSSTTSRGRSAR